MILDTSFVLDLVDGDDGAVKTFRDLETSDVPLVLPAMTVLEVYVGFGKHLDSAEERRQLDRVLRSYPQADLTTEMAARAGRLIGDLAREDEHVLEKADAAIAVTALERDEAILTRNVDDFEPVPNLDVESY